MSDGALEELLGRISQFRATTREVYAFVGKHPELRDELSEALDDYVHDAASAVASTVNNQGLGHQVGFLAEHGWLTKGDK